ncbi:MAG: PepSY domain-containing protein [Alphaproteobacteria bacterium]
MTIMRASLVGASLLAAAVAGGLAAASAETPIAEVLRPEGITITGTVTDIFGNRFVLQDDSGKVLVETGPQWHDRVEVKPGERVTVSGRPERGFFHAFAVTRADGTRIELQPPGPPPGGRGPGPGMGPMGGPGMGPMGGPPGERGPGMGPMGGPGMGPIGGRGPGMGPMAGRADGPGRGPGMGFMAGGPRHVAPEAEKSREALKEILRQAGYRDIEDMERKRHHYEVEARNRFGEKVEVHIDFAGNIYKEKRDD